jgi:hypothetical protein
MPARMAVTAGNTRRSAFWFGLSTMALSILRMWIVSAPPFCPELAGTGVNPFTQHDKYRGGALPQGSRKQLFNRMGRYETPGAGPGVAAYLDLAEEAGLDPAQMALAFVASRPFVTAAIINVTSLAQLKTDIASLQVRIAPDLKEQMDAIHLRHCNPCP